MSEERVLVAIARLEEKMDSAIEKMDGQAKRLDNHSSRLRTLENRQHWYAGAAAGAVLFLSKTLTKLGF